MQRYIRLFVFLASLVLLLFVSEGILRFFDAPISLRAPRGSGQILMFAISLFCIMLFVRHVSMGNIYEYFAHYARNWKRALAGLLTMFASSILLSAIVFSTFLWFGMARWSPEHWAALDTKTILIAMQAVFVALILATTEEVIFRGSFMRYLRDSMTLGPTLAAILVSSLIFSVSHMIALRNPGVSIPPLLAGLFLLGVLLATTYVVTGSLACAIGLHAGLLGFKVILRNTQLGSFAGDVRSGADFYVMMVLLTVIIIICRKRLWKWFAIEPAAMLDDDIRQKRVSSFEPGRAPAIWG